jgi:hypothetical protein
MIRGLNVTIRVAVVENLVPCVSADIFGRAPIEIELKSISCSEYGVYYECSIIALV